ncbi:S24 family peptidase [Vagococcus sp. WN89Y]|uniref:S24 family peptidase n=1 Tax=Vagococcus sp. WN89Y TaxID=3457258 RepID=UPI003FCE9012
MKKISISKRIIHRMSVLNLKGKDLVTATGATKGTVSQWINGKNAPSFRYIISLANILKVSEFWLLSGDEITAKSNLSYSKSVITALPLLPLKQKNNWSDIIKKSLSNDPEHPKNDIPEQTFSVVITDDSMINTNGKISIPNGATIFVEPCKTATHGNVVMALPEGTNTPLIRRLEINKTEIRLISTNPDYPPIKIPDCSCIVGICVRMQQDI